MAPSASAARCRAACARRGCAAPTSPSPTSTRRDSAASSPARSTASAWKAASATPRGRKVAGARPRSSLVRAGVGVVLEAGVLPQEGELHHADRAVALLEEVDLGDPLIRRVGVVDLVAVDGEDQVRVLLDRA